MLRSIITGAAVAALAATAVNAEEATLGKTLGTRVGMLEFTPGTTELFAYLAGHRYAAIFPTT